METKLIICPNCSKPTINQRTVNQTEKIVEIPLKEYAENQLEWERGKPHFSSSASSEIFFGKQIKAVQLVFTCSTCGYTKAYDV